MGNHCFTIERVNHSAIVLLIGDDGKIVTVCEPDKPLPIFHKCPGGGGENDETPEETAIREIQEETGIELAEEDLIRIGEPFVTKNDHTKYHFLARVVSWDKLKRYGREDEIVNIIHQSQIGRLNFLPVQKRWWQDHHKELRAEGIDLPW